VGYGVALTDAGGGNSKRTGRNYRRDVRWQVDLLAAASLRPLSYAPAVRSLTLTTISRHKRGRLERVALSFPT
jgi:hypothetical protein